MKIEIFDVDHGQCAMIHCPPNGKKLMIDAGHSDAKKWWPSKEFYGQNIEKLIISHYDEDHVSDLAGIRNNCYINAINRNPTISSANLIAMKAETGLGEGTRNAYEYLKWLESLPNGAPANIDLGHVITKKYYNSYGMPFVDTNDLSVVTFVSYGQFCILFPGDLEKTGWQKLLLNPQFIEDLKQVNVLVASHHGRENGYCEEVFNYFTPQAVIISDDYIQYDSQQTTKKYANKTSGCITTTQEKRNVLTTRCDGKITIDVFPNGQWNISTSSRLRQSLYVNN